MGMDDPSEEYMKSLEGGDSKEDETTIEVDDEMSDENDNEDDESLIADEEKYMMEGPIGEGSIGSSSDAGLTVYSLFVETDKVFALTIDATSGKIVSQKPVPFDNFGEMTRYTLALLVVSLYSY